jgi:hypothetical protein
MQHVGIYMFHLTRERLKKCSYWFPVRYHAAMMAFSMSHLIKGKTSTLRRYSVHMFHLSNNVLKNVLLMFFPGGTMWHDSVQSFHQKFLRDFLFFLFFK